MADIRTYPFVRHLRGAPARYVHHVARGRVAHAGVAQSFWLRPRSAALSEVPVDDRELPLHFHARTRDYQDVVVQATVSYRVASPELAVARIDFGVDPATGRWTASPLEQLGSLISELAQQHSLELLASLPLPDALAGAVPRLRERIAAGLAADPRLAETGVEIVGVRVGAIAPEPDVEKALGMPAREVVQQQADRATFERRALAVESERAIAENELQNQIELARREEELVAQRGENERRTAADAAAVSRIEAEALAEATRTIGQAEGDAERAKVAAYAELEPPILLGLALKQLAANMPQIERLTLAPDVLGDALAKVAGTR